jgi:hypothetical protein
MTIRGIIQVLGAVVGISALWWVVDEIGDRREAKVLARINAAIEATNADTRAANTLEDKIAAVQEAAREKALADVAKLKGRHIMTAEEAASLNEVQ